MIKAVCHVKSFNVTRLYRDFYTLRVENRNLQFCHSFGAIGKLLVYVDNKD